MDATGIKCNFFGYDEQTKGFRVWEPSLQRIVVSRDVRFLAEDSKKIENLENPSKIDMKSKEEATDKYVDHYFYPDPEVEESSKDDDQGSDNASSDDSDDREDSDSDDDSDDGSEGSSDQETDDQNEGNPNNEETPNQSKRGRGGPKIIRTGLRGGPKKQFQEKKVAETDTDLPEKRPENSEVICIINEYTQEIAYSTEVRVLDALNSLESGEWNDAILSEIESLIKNVTWSITKLPEGQHLIGSRLVLRNKYLADGSVER